MYLDTLTLLFLMVAILIIVAVVVEYKQTPKVIDDCEYRERLLHAIQNLRLYKMLLLLHVPMERYVVSAPLSEIKSHVTACRGCTELGVCDRCLRNGVPDKDMSFCPNYESLLKCRKALNLAG